MGIQDSCRQLYLLLWKNYILKKRKKIRLLFEIVWPLCLFVILVLLRAQGFRIHQPQCHFTERPLPSAGIIPFVRGYVCELNNSCSQTPRQSYFTYSENITELGRIFLDYLQFALDSDVLNLFMNSTKLIENIRNTSYKITENLTLNDVIKCNRTEFAQKLANLSLNYNSSSGINISISLIDSILDSKPNLNYLYSKYSQTYYEPLSILLSDSSLPQSIMNAFYGPDLDLIELNRPTNNVFDSEWIRLKFCANDSNGIYLLRGPNQEELKDFLCNKLNDSQLANLVLLISEQIDYSLVKEKVSSIAFSNQNFDQIFSIFQSWSDLKKKFENSNLTSYEDLLAKLESFELSDLCDSGSKLNIFNIFSKLNFKDFKEIEKTRTSFSLRRLFMPKIDLKTMNGLTKHDTYQSLSDKLDSLKLKNSEKCKTDEQTCFCDELFRKMESKSQVSKQFFSLIKPLIVGKILYAPNTSTAINQLIIRMNSTFNNINQMADLFQKIASITDRILSQLNQFNLDTLTELKQNLRLISEYAVYSNKLLHCYDMNKFVGFSTEHEAVKYGQLLMENKTFWAAIIFDANASNTSSTLPKIVNYKIRMDSTYTHNTAYLQDIDSKYGASTCQTCNKYFLYGFIYLQDMLEKAIVEMKTNQSYEMGLTAIMTPYPCWVKDKFITKIIYFMPLFMVLAWIFFVSMTVKDIVQEKEKRLKEFMRVMGLSNLVHWLAWFITAFLLMFIIICLLSVIVKYGKIMSWSDITVLSTFFTCFAFATVTQCFLISVFFNKANLAAVVGGIVYFMLYLPFTVLVKFAHILLPSHKLMFSLSSTIAFGFGVEIIGILELEEKGAQWSNFNEPPAHLANSLTLFQVCGMLILDALIYLILTLYIECIWPGEYGIGKPWYFIFDVFFWYKSKRRITKPPLFLRFFSSVSSKKKKIFEDQEKNKSNITEAFDSIEPIDDTSADDLKAGIEIENLNKVYSRGNNHALKGLSIKFYKNEITSFLGHNGAGKSTTMHLLTGLYMPTSGTAKINGLLITEQMNEIRKSLGFVPQHNILFDLMTVKEHLWFYSRMKGLSCAESLAEMKKMLTETGLELKKNECSSHLSGGMKRKLSVAIAFVGGSQTVILDEPSAGVDPSGRRDIWDMLLKYKSPERTIIISTHHMDEADVLGDRIAIISNGKLIAHGTAYFLKQKFGRGYYLTFAKKDSSKFNESLSLSSRRNSNSTDSGISTVSASNSQETIFSLNQELKSNPSNLLTQRDQLIYQFVKKRFRNALLVENIGSEMTFSVSNKAEFTKDYEEYFSQIEANMNELGIDSMGISDTTLEEIFIKIAKEPENNSFQAKDLTICNVNLTSLKQKLFGSDKPPIKLDEKQLENYSKFTKERVNGQFKLILNQFYALSVKRLKRIKRNKKGFFAEIVLPIVFVCFALLVAILKPSTDINANRPSIELHPWHYQAPNKIFLSKSSSLNYSIPSYSTFGNSSNFTELINTSEQPNIELINQITESLFSNGLGTRCTNGHSIKKLTCEPFNFKLLNATKLDSQVVSQLNAVNYSQTKIAPCCTCINMYPFQSCEKSSSGDINYRRIYELKSKDILFDLTGRNVTDWLIKTELSQQFDKMRYGGYEFLQPNENKILESLIENIKNLTSTTFTGSNPLVSNQNVKIWYNLNGYDSSVAYLNAFNNAVLKSKMNAMNLDSNEHAIVAFNHPMNYTKSQFFSKIQNQSMMDLFVSICIIFALSFIPASFLVYILEERENQSKELQFVSGVKPYLYWVTNYILDLFNYLVPCTLCIFVFFIFDVKAYLSEQNFPCLVCLFLLYGWSSIPLMYPLNYLFKVASTAFVITSCLNIFIGIITVMTVNVLKQLAEDEPYLLSVHDALKPIFIVVFPHYCLGQGFIEMAYLYNMAEFKREFGIKNDYNPFDFNKNGQNLLAMFLQGIVYFTFNIFIQYKFFIRFKPETDLNKINLQMNQSNNDVEDEDVANERHRILNKKMEDNGADHVRLVNVTKIFKKVKLKKLKIEKHLAVNNLCLGIRRGECFGLIGINGAGKTTTFKMITGELPITAGDIFVDGISVSKNIEKVHKNIGYCPQFDAIMPLLTAREHLVFFARLRGIPECYVKQVSEWAMNRVGLEVFADRISGDFSGGNKRKLSTAIALIGDPSVICLDEPTSGMDAKARRLLWNDILSLIKENRIVILTSHSMEECEALCTRLVIMVNGKFKCLGSPQHLRSKFGNGIKLAVRLENLTDKQNLIEFIKCNFVDSFIQESHKNLFEFIIKNAKLSEIFGKMERNREIFQIKDYSVSQTTLDQIFINFAKANKEKTKANDVPKKSNRTSEQIQMNSFIIKR